MIINSDFHIHSECSYDATNKLEAIAEGAIAQGLTLVGITDHLNFNDESFKGNIRESATKVGEAQAKYPNLVLGVELTPIEKPEFDYIKRMGVRDGYVAPVCSEPYGIELGMSKEELIRLGVKYAVGACHWRVDIPNGRTAGGSLDERIAEWYRQQMWLISDGRVTILGHPWWGGDGYWYDDFSLIPRSMNLELAAAIKENGKLLECNSSFFTRAKTSERFRYQYAEFLRELFELGIKVTYGSDQHHEYADLRPQVEKYLSAAGFKDGDFYTLGESDLW